jgi:type IV pilus assembly protein PilA
VRTWRSHAHQTKGIDQMRNLSRRLATHKSSDDGFSLMELAVVILIIGILVGIAVPSFLVVRKNAQNRLAQSTLRKFLISAEAEAADSEGSYAAATATGIGPLEPGSTALDRTASSSGPLAVSIDAQATYWAAAASSKNGECFFVRESNASGTRFGRTRDPAVTCNAATAATSATGPSW